MAFQLTPTAASGPSDASCKDEPYTYDNGPLGQSHWCGECNLECSEPQAPININTKNARLVPDLPVIGFTGYKNTQLVTSKNPHNLKVDYGYGNSFVRIGGEGYKLKEFHFHRPGEEAIDNHRPAMVIHLVHYKENTAVAIAIMVEGRRCALSKNQRAGQEADSAFSSSRRRPWS